MAYTIVSPQPPLRDPALAWDEAGPGLYDDGELLVELVSIFAAISVRPEWLENGAGVAFHGTARWCDDAGETQMTVAGQHVESFIDCSFNPIDLGAHGFDALKKEVLLALMGEEPALTMDDGAGNQVPVVALSGAVRANASIRRQMEIVQAMASGAETAALLA